jgi:hypothetical protein
MSNAVELSFIVLCFMLVGTAVGTWLRRRLPTEHLSEEAGSVVKLGVGLIATLSALVLGLLIASAKSSFDLKTNELNQITADAVLIDQLLAEYGPETRPIRERLRTGMRSMAESLWSEGDEAISRTFTPSAAGLETYRLINSLPADSDLRRALSSQAAEAAKHLTQMRLLLFAQSGPAIPIPFLVTLAFWLAIIFASFSLFGPSNATVFTFTFLFAISAAGAIFLICQLSNPFTGLLQIPKDNVVNALAVLPP